jgi:hypothetical protein
MGLGERVVCWGGGLRQGGIAAPHRSSPPDGCLRWTPLKVDAACSIGGGFAPLRDVLEEVATFRHRAFIRCNR